MKNRYFAKQTYLLEILHCKKQAKFQNHVFVNIVFHVGKSPLHSHKPMCHAPISSSWFVGLVVCGISYRSCVSGYRPSTVVWTSWSISRTKLPRRIPMGSVRDVRILPPLGCWWPSRGSRTHMRSSSIPVWRSRLKPRCYRDCCRMRSKRSSLKSWRTIEYTLIVQSKDTPKIFWKLNLFRLTAFPTPKWEWLW